MKKIYFDSSRCLGCHSCHIACAVEHSKTKVLCEAILEDDTPIPRRNVQLVAGSCLTVACRHCDPAPCVEACISGAMRKDDVTGEVTCDTDKCVACWMCVMICPFDAVHPGKIYTIKCDMCPDMEDAYACVTACPTGALFVASPEEFEQILQSRRETKQAEPVT